MTPAYVKLTQDYPTSPLDQAKLFHVAHLNNVSFVLETQEHPDAITPQGPRSTQTPLQHKPPPGTQEHPDTIGLEGPRSTQTPLDQEDPGVTKRYWTKRTQKYPRHHWTRRSQKHP
ncbi:hypothetical protein STEG23_001800 [Scotinomys teguina]